MLSSNVKQTNEGSAMYRLYQPHKNKRHRKIIWLTILSLVVAGAIGGTVWVHRTLKADVVLGQSTTVTSQVSYNNPTKLYTEKDFSISIPTTWQMLPPPVSQYQSYTWQSPNRVTDGQELIIYEDAIPVNLAVNRVLVVQSEDTQLSLDGTVSDNCATFTTNAPLPNSPAALAKWNGVNFYCDKSNQARDVVGTSSLDGINTVIFKNLNTGVSHKFFMTYIDDSIDPDYTPYYNALESFRFN